LRNLNNANVLAPSLLSIFVPFLAILYLFTKEKKILGAACSKSPEFTAALAGDYKIWVFLFWNRK